MSSGLTGRWPNSRQGHFCCSMQSLRFPPQRADCSGSPSGARRRLSAPRWRRLRSGSAWNQSSPARRGTPWSPHFLPSAAKMFPRHCRLGRTSPVREVCRASAVVPASSERANLAAYEPRSNVPWSCERLPARPESGSAGKCGARAKFENNHMFISEPNGAMQ